MAPHKRTEITIETERVVTIRRRRSMRARCPTCGREVDMVSLAEAETLTGMNGKVLREYAAERGWHLIQGQDGSDLICLESWVKPA